MSKQAINLTPVYINYSVPDVSIMYMNLMSGVACSEKHQSEFSRAIHILAKFQLVTVSKLYFCIRAYYPMIACKRSVVYMALCV